MFVGRERGVRQLDRMYVKSGFQMAVVYGRRRAGKPRLSTLSPKISQRCASRHSSAARCKTSRSFPASSTLFSDCRKMRARFPIGEVLLYVGKQFETVCQQWVVRRNGAGGLPFLASSFGRWRGADPREKAETDIDLIAADKESKSILLGECKRRNSFNESKAIELLEHRATLVKGYEHRSFCLFTRNPASEAARKKAESRLDLKLVSVADMFPGR